jgi:cytochrome c oxidase assembly protein subunit 15
MKPKAAQLESRWPHRLAVAMVCATFPLIFVGGLVTTYQAGMAVPDWPSTYGYNLFLYPWETWFFGPWDLFIEHGHRLLGALVGMITILFVLAVFLHDPRGWMKALSVVALVAVIAQGVLGGARVLLDQRTLAMIHGCFGPAFFALCAALAVFTSRRWREAASGGGTIAASPSAGARVKRFGLITLALSYAQILLGAQLRHPPIDMSPYSFRALVLLHLAMALVLAGHVAALAALVLLARTDGALARPTFALAGLLVLQIGLGIGTWIVNYSWPNWDETFPFAAGYTIQAEGMLQTNVVTSHMAVGSLILATSMMIVARGLRLLRPAALNRAEAAVAMEAAA